MRRAIFGLMLLVIASAAVAQTPRVRINIEDASFNLAAYKRAIQILKDRDKDPDFKNDPVNSLHNSYNYFADLHNDFSSDEHGCVHGSEVFLPWHRELLNRFELALRAAEPGTTDNVTIPYWVWTEKDGVYPAAFTDPSSPLFSRTRNKKLVCPEECPFTTEQIRQMLDASPEWLEFAGGACSVSSSCSPGKNCSQCPGSDFGAFESPFHNRMHVALGRPMSNPTTAAQDPIFWSFHAYIDLVYQQWQCKYAKPPNCPECNFRAMTDRKVKDVLDIEHQLGYVYDAVPSCSVALAAVAMPQLRAAAAPKLHLVNPPRHIALGAPSGAAEARLAHGIGPHVFDVTIPRPNFETADIVISGLPHPATYSYSGRVFLYPANMELKAGDADFASRHQIGSLSVWERPGEHASHDTARVKIEATNAFRYLAQTEHGAHWKIAVVFDPPTVEEGTSPVAATKALGFTRIELVLDFDPKE